MVVVVFVVSSSSILFSSLWFWRQCRIHFYFIFFHFFLFTRKHWTQTNAEQCPKSIKCSMFRLLILSFRNDDIVFVKALSSSSGFIRVTFPMVYWIDVDGWAAPFSIEKQWKFYCRQSTTTETKYQHLFTSFIVKLNSQNNTRRQIEIKTKIFSRIEQIFFYLMKCFEMNGVFTVRNRSRNDEIELVKF